jgi:ribosomal protein S18 acetylase RimI-like enzyme
LIRPASLNDLAAIWELANDHELRVDPEFEPYPRSEIEQQIKGFVEPGHPFVFESDGIQAAILIHSYSSRSLIELDLFCSEDYDSARELFGFGLDYCRKTWPGFRFRTACNKLDTKLLEIFESFSLEFYRDYYKLIKPAIKTGFPALPEGVEIRAVSLEEFGEQLHRVEVESFASHFGYTKLGYQDWLAERQADESLDHEGCFLLVDHGQPVGMVLSSNSRADVNGGWLDKLGVVPESQGKGYGRLLLRWGVAHAAAKGFSDLGLGADTGNDSGALELYQSEGFEVQLSWRAYQLATLS